MTGRSDTERFLDAFLAPERADQLSDGVLQAALSDIARTPQRRALRVPWRFTNMPVFARAAAAALALVVVVGAGGVIYLNSGGLVGGPNPTATPSPSPTPSASPTSEPVAVRIMYYSVGSGLWAVDPNASPPVPTLVRSGPEGIHPLGWSSDGARLLIQKGDENLFVLNADGSATQVTEPGFNEGAGSARPAGATISPDGSRVVFAGKTTTVSSCDDGALFAVDADGGPAGVLWRSQIDGIVRYPTFSPDGTQIAFADGNCDNSHSVWVMNADGTNAHEIVPSELSPLDLAGGYVLGLAWSPAGDRIALSFQGFEGQSGTYTFATDGSDFKRPRYVRDRPCWPPTGSYPLFAYRFPCFDE